MAQGRDGSSWDGVDRRHRFVQFSSTITLGTLVTVLTAVASTVVVLVTLGRWIEMVEGSIVDEARARQAQTVLTDRTLTDLSHELNSRLDYVQQQEQADVKNMIGRFGDLQREVYQSGHRRNDDGGMELPALGPHDNHG